MVDKQSDAHEEAERLGNLQVGKKGGEIKVSSLEEACGKRTRPEQTVEKYKWMDGFSVQRVLQINPEVFITMRC